jgi:tetratricopeptide (TPR) repeat protein
MTHHRRHVGPAVVLLGALAVLAFAVPASGQTLDAWKQYQDDLARAGEKERLLSEFKQRAASEESAVNRYLLGRVYGLIEDLAKARVEFELSLEMDPDYVPSLKGLAVCHLGTREPDLAIEKLRRCRKLAPDDGDVVTMLADALGQTGKRTEALRLLEGYLQKEPEHVQSRYLLAILLFQTGEFERAEFEFRTVINLDPTRVQARSDLAHCLLQLQDYAGAIEQMRKAVELAPQFPPFRIKLSQFLANAGRYEEAREALRPLLEMELPPETKEQIGRQIKALELYAKGLIGPGAGIEDAERVGQLLELLKDEDVQIRRNAVLQLSQFVFPNGLPQQILRCLQDEDQQIRVAVIRMVASNKDVRAVPVLCLLLRHKTERDESWIARGAIVDTLLALESPAAYPALLSALQDESPYVLELTLRALRLLTGERFVTEIVPGEIRPLVVDRLKDLQQAWWLWWQSERAQLHKLRTIRAIGELGKSAMLRYLVPLLKDTDAKVFDAAYEAFTNIAGVSFGRAKDADARKRIAEEAVEWLRK